MNIPSSRRATYTNNDITYTWDNVSEIKYYNWMKMTSPEKREDFTVDGFPFFIQIEPTNYCNLKCPICPAGGLGFKRSKRHMNLGEFKSIIDDMEDYLLFITLWDWGEPLLNPELPEMISYAAERDIKTVVSTNCNCMHFHDEAYMERLLRSGLSTLILAVDSLHQDSYEMYRKKGDLAGALAGIKRVISLKKKLDSETLLILRMVVMRQNEHQIAAMRRLARNLGVDRFSLKTVNPLYIAESSDKDIVPKNPRYRRYQYKEGTFERLRKEYTCDIVWRQCTIHSNGNIVPCCWFYDEDHKAGNVLSNGGLKRLWNSQSYRDFRRKILLDKESISYCKTCTFNYKFSRAGWFLQTLDLTQSRKDQYTYLLKRYVELNMYPNLLKEIIRTRDKVKSFLGCNK